MSGTSLSHADKVRAEGVEVSFGDPVETHRIKFDLFAMMELDRVTGKNPFNGELWSDARPSTIASLLWAGLLHEGAPTTVEHLARKISMADLNKLPGQLMEAYQQGQAPAEEKKTVAGVVEEATQESQPIDQSTG